MKDTIIQDIITAANFKLAGIQLLLEKEAAGKGGISNPMGGSAKSTATKGVKTAPVMSAAPINDLLPKATTAQSAGLPALTQLPTANATQSGTMNNAVLPMMKSSAFIDKLAAAYPSLKLPEARANMAKSLLDLKKRFPMKGPASEMIANRTRRDIGREGGLAAAKGLQEDLGYRPPAPQRPSFFRELWDYATQKGHVGMLFDQIKSDFFS